MNEEILKNIEKAIQDMSKKEISECIKDYLSLIRYFPDDVVIKYTLPILKKYIKE
tara:strand:- start:40 stop:204 length:165 start_codon:yes stop_codon:yes gene_type:complete